MTFAMSTMFSGVSHIVNTATGQYTNLDYEQLQVKIKTLDDVISEEKIKPTSIGLIKIDVEGHEYNVLRGGPKTLAAMAEGSRLIIEIHPDADRIRSIIDYLTTLSFTYQRLDEENFIFTKY